MKAADKFLLIVIFVCWVAMALFFIFDSDIEALATVRKPVATSLPLSSELSGLPSLEAREGQPLSDYGRMLDVLLGHTADAPRGGRVSATPAHRSLLTAHPHVA